MSVLQLENIMKYLFLGISILALAYSISKTQCTFNLYVHAEFPDWKMEPIIPNSVEEEM